jgi:hypothetical protein
MIDFAKELNHRCPCGRKLSYSPDNDYVSHFCEHSFGDVPFAHHFSIGRNGSIGYQYPNNNNFISLLWKNNLLRFGMNYMGNLNCSFEKFKSFLVPYDQLVKKYKTLSLLL